MTSAYLVEKSKRQSSLLSQSGQAMVEYVLVLVVSVALVAALAYQIFRPMRSFIQDYMGSYISCLLETGELPSLGNETSKTALEDAGCNAKFQPATLANGRPPVDAGSSASDKSSSSKGGSDSESSSDGGVGGSANAGQAPGRNLLVSSLKKRAGADGGKAPDSKTVEIPIGETGSKFYNRKTSSAFDQNRNGKTTALGIAGFTTEEKKKRERKENSNRTVATGENFGPPPKKIPIQKPVATANVDDNDNPMTIGNFFRILLIVGIIIALFMVLGSQALKIVKSQEK
jgi:hypothetical protein